MSLLWWSLISIKRKIIARNKLSLLLPQWFILSFINGRLPWGGPTDLIIQFYHYSEYPCQKYTIRPIIMLHLGVYPLVFVHDQLIVYEVHLFILWNLLFRSLLFIFLSIFFLFCSICLSKFYFCSPYFNELSFSFIFWFILSFVFCFPSLYDSCKDWWSYCKMFSSGFVISDVSMFPRLLTLFRAGGIVNYPP